MKVNIDIEGIGTPNQEGRNAHADICCAWNVSMVDWETRDLASVNQHEKGYHHCTELIKLCVPPARWKAHVADLEGAGCIFLNGA